jgi:hypothetical protein
MIKHQIDWEPQVCCIDPISLGIASLTSMLSAGGTGAALTAGLAGAGAGLAGASLAGGESSASQTPPTIAPPPGPNAASAPVGTKSGQGAKLPTSPSFVGSAALPQQSGYGGKTLLGQ